MDRLLGKIRRTATSFVYQIDENRSGNCKGCGSCCMFLYKCPFLRFDEENSNKAVCTVYRFRPPMCKKYPRTKSEQMHQPCGYYFNDTVLK